MNDATTLIVPGETPALEPTPSGGIGSAWWALLGVVVLAVVWAAWANRRRRRLDPRESAFRRIAQAQGWNRATVRALRRAAFAQGLESPVGIALSPALTERAVAAHDRRR